jgi:hypothetical protein
MTTGNIAILLGGVVALGYGAFTAQRDRRG